MRLLSRVVWSEGMYLGPQHFQAQGRYFEDSVRFAVSSLWYQPYGLLGYALDEEALRNGTLSLVHARGMFPDGMPFLMPESDALPAARPIAELFPPTRDRLTALLAIPQHNPNGVNCALSPEANHARFLAETRTFCDETSGSDERPVQVGRKNIALLLDTEPAEGLVTLPLARDAGRLRAPGLRPGFYPALPANQRQRAAHAAAAAADRDPGGQKHLAGAHLRRG